MEKEKVSLSVFLSQKPISDDQKERFKNFLAQYDLTEDYRCRLYEWQLVYEDFEHRMPSHFEPMIQDGMIIISSATDEGEEFTW